MGHTTPLMREKASAYLREKASGRRLVGQCVFEGEGFWEKASACAYMREKASSYLRAKASEPHDAPDEVA